MIFVLFKLSFGVGFKTDFYTADLIKRHVWTWWTTWQFTHVNKHVTCESHVILYTQLIYLHTRFLRTDSFNIAWFFKNDSFICIWFFTHDSFIFTWDSLEITHLLSRDSLKTIHLFTWFFTRNSFIYFVLATLCLLRVRCLAPVNTACSFNLHSTLYTWIVYFYVIL